MVFGFGTEIKRQAGTDGKEYKLCDGTFYSAEALDGAILALEYARANKIRIREADNDRRGLSCNEGNRN